MQLNLKMKSYNNKRFVESVIVSLLIFLIATISFIYSNQKGFLFAISIVLCVFDICFLLTEIKRWSVAKSVLNNSSKEISNIKELNDACEDKNKEKFDSFVDRAQKTAEIKAKMDPNTYKNIIIKNEDNKDTK